MQQQRTFILIIGLTLLLIWGFYRLFELRFSEGDIYPVGSSQRSDPVGTRALYEALGLQPGVRVDRLLLPLERRRPPTPSTLLFLGLETVDLESGSGLVDWLAVDRFIRQGGRVVLAVNPKSPIQHSNSLRQLFRPTLPAGADEFIELAPSRLWEFEINVDTQLHEEAVRAPEFPDPLPGTLPWNSVHGFNPQISDWQVVYRRDKMAVAMERNLGSGSLVLLGSSHLLSNQGLRSWPSPEWIRWLIGPNAWVFFDETHLGLRADPSLVGLLRTYRLGGAFSGALVVVALYLWRQGVRHPTHRSSRDPAAPMDGRDNQAALVNLIRRSVPPSHLTPAFFSLWTQSLGRQPFVSDALLADLQLFVDQQNALKPRERDPVQTYHAIRQRLHRTDQRPPSFRSDISHGS